MQIIVTRGIIIMSPYFHTATDFNFWITQVQYYYKQSQISNNT